MSNYPGVRTVTRPLAILALLALAWAAHVRSDPPDDKPAKDKPKPAIYGMLDVTRPPYSAKGDGIADDTAALQSALDALGDPGPITRRIYLPAGTYRTTAPLVYRGSYPWGCRISGDAASGGLFGSVLLYDGPQAACSVLEIAGGVDCTIEHLALDAGTKAQFGVYAHWTPERAPLGIGVNHLTLHRVVVGRVDVRSGRSACISVGVDTDDNSDTHQVDDVQIVDCKLIGGDRGIVTGNANVKNFFVHRTGIWFMKKYGVDYGLGGAGSGVCSIRDSNFLSNTLADVRAGVGSLTIDSCQSEGSGALLLNYGMTKNIANARIVGVDWHGKARDDDVVVKFQGALRLEGNQISNDRTVTSIPRIQLDWGADMPSSLDSSQNHYHHAAANYTDGRQGPVFVDGSGMDLFKQPGRSGFVRCFGDYGGVPGGIVPMRGR